MDLYVCKMVVCDSISQIRRVPIFYLLMLRTAMGHSSRVLARLGSVSLHQAQKSCCVFAQKFTFSSLTEVIKGKEGQEHFQMHLMKRHYPRWAGNRSSTYSAPSSFIRRQSWSSQSINRE